MCNIWANNHQEDSDEESQASPDKRTKLSTINRPQNLLSLSQDVDLKSRLEKDSQLRSHQSIASLSPKNKSR